MPYKIHINNTKKTMTKKETDLFNKGITVSWFQDGIWFKVKVTDNGIVKLGEKEHKLKFLKVAIQDTIDYLHNKYFCNNQNNQ